MNWLALFVTVVIACINIFDMAWAANDETDLKSKTSGIVEHNPTKELLERIQSKDMKRQNIRKIQELLEELGYDPGPVDGLMGLKTQIALTKWKEETNQSVSLEWTKPRPKTTLHKPKSSTIAISGTNKATLQKTGESFVLHFKSVRLHPSRNITKSWVESVGQTIRPIDSSHIIYTAGPILSIDKGRISMEVAETTMEFFLDSNTITCDGPHKITWNSLQKGNMITVFSRLSNRNNAVKIRKGPILVRGLSQYGGALKIPVNDKSIDSCR